MTSIHRVNKILVKRPHHQANEPSSKRHHPDNSQISINDCVELCSLLLEKAGSNLSPQKANSNPAEFQAVLSKTYSPRVAELLTSIAVSLDSKPGSDVSSEDDEPCTDALVPFLTSDVPTAVRPRPLAESDAVVPSFVPQVPSVPFTNEKQRVPALKKQKISPPPVEITAYKKDTEIAISRIFDLGKVSSVVDSSIPADAPYSGPSVVTMTGFGELGRFGNQVMQYMFLKSLAVAHGVSEIQVPGWVGAGLFGLNDRLVQRQFPAVVEYHGTKANSTFTDDFIEYVKRSNPGRTVPELSPAILESGTESGVVTNVDVWGWFQWHSKHFAPFKHIIQNTFAPVPALQDHCERIFNEKVRFAGGRPRTVVGLHLRLGDYQNIAASSFGYCAPTSWYLEWLEEIWPTLNDPVLFVASDDVNAIIDDFKKYNPLTGDSIGLKMPKDMKGLKAGFFPDWFGLTQCDVLAISNSTFSFSACMMNKVPGTRFYRAHYRERMMQIDPWNAEPIVHRDMNKIGLAKALETLQVVYNTQGSKGLARNLLYELPYYGVRAAIMKAVLWRQANAKAATV